MKWVKLNRYCELTGDTPDAVYAKNRRKIWAEGVHYRKAADGCLWINLEEVEKWVECEAPYCPANNGTSPPQSAAEAVRTWNKRVANA